MRVPAGALGLVLVTDGRGDGARILRIARAAIAGGVRAVQLREPGWTAHQLGALCGVLRGELEAVNGVLLVNDRADIAAAGLCHGVHLGHRSLKPAMVRGFLPDAVVGYSAHDPGELRVAVEAGCDYASLSPVLATSCKPGAVAIGVEQAGEWTAECAVPVVWLGGIDLQTVGEVVRGAKGVPAGIAVRSALCEATDPEAVARELLAAGA